MQKAVNRATSSHAETQRRPITTEQYFRQVRDFCPRCKRNMTHPVPILSTKNADPDDALHLQLRLTSPYFLQRPLPYPTQSSGSFSFTSLLVTPLFLITKESRL